MLLSGAFNKSFAHSDWQFVMMNLKLFYMIEERPCRNGYYTECVDLSRIALVCRRTGAL